MRSQTHLLALSLLLGACTQAPDLTVEIDDFTSQVNTVRGGVCMCAEDAGYDSMVACGDALGLAGEPENQCIGAVLEDLGEAGADYLECATIAYSDGAACLLANTDCETGQVNTCEQAREAALAACTQLSSLDALAVDACL